MTVFYLLRHGHANYALAEERRLEGISRHLVPLTPNGHNQIKKVVGTLREFQAEIIISSPITRALQTAAILSRLLDLPLEVEFDLHEWTPELTFSYDQEFIIRAAYREMMKFSGEWPQKRPKNWEPLSSVRQRVLNVLLRYCNLKKVIVVSHGVVIASLTEQEIETGSYYPFILDDAGNIS